MKHKSLHVFDSITKGIFSLYKSLGFGETITLYLYSITCIVALFLVAVVIHYIFRLIIVVVITRIAQKSTTYFDDLLVDNKAHVYGAYLIPVYFLDKTIPLALTRFEYWENMFQRITSIVITLLIVMVIRSLLRTFRDYLKTLPIYSDKPIDSFVQIVMILLWIIGIVIIISKMFDVETRSILTTFGAVSAIGLLIFRDPLLGFVASVQVASNDMVRIGDWITMDKYGADGDVIEINLTTVKVKNFNNAITTIPTYSLISDSFYNWRGMLTSGGRRIKRHVLIKAISVRLLTDDDFEKLDKIQLVRKYSKTKREKINRLNKQHDIDDSHPINGMTMTNLGMFRRYLTLFLESHSAINKDLPLLVHQLQHIPQGIPLEIYCFCKDKNFENFESIVSGIFDHIFVSARYFDLEVFELTSQIKPAETTQPTLQSDTQEEYPDGKK